ncbi:holo-ACP synthase [Candidatus Pacearchaeota archaeon]|nr:holo-ACP synthase [Candidatus Pacearchaeota archaeon]
MIIGHGIDTIEVERVEKAIDRFGDRFLSRIYTDYERSLCDYGKGQARFQRYAGYWASKEAAMKALGTGNRQGVTYKDIETRHDPSGRPYLVLYGRASELANCLGVENKVVSITHVEKNANASVIFEKFN